MIRWTRYLRVFALVALCWIILVKLFGSRSGEGEVQQLRAGGGSVVKGRAGAPSDKIAQQPVDENPRPNFAKPLEPTLAGLSLQLPLEPAPGETTCSTRYGQRYLHNFWKRRRSYCHPKNSQSRLGCFGADITGDRIDVFCVAESVLLNSEFGVLEIDCDIDGMVEESKEEQKALPLPEEFPSYWYETGPKWILENNINLARFNPKRWDLNGEICGQAEKVAGKNEDFTILVKRESSGNTWHSMMEIFSMMLSIDVLQVGQTITGAEGDNGKQDVVFRASDIPNTQVVILDDFDDGPYFDLWTVFSGKPPLRLNSPSTTSSSESKTTPSLQCLKNVIFPLPGASNPLWQGDWEPQFCSSSSLIETFTARILSHYHLLEPRNSTAPVTVTFISRKENRKLKDEAALFYAIHRLYPHLKIRIQDFATIPFEEQLRVIRSTDILVGVHGAGLTHALWLRPGSVLFEIRPRNLNHQGFRNLAKLLNLKYFSEEADGGERGMHVDTSREGEGTELIDQRQEPDQVWFWRDVEITKSKFLGVMEQAVIWAASRDDVDLAVERRLLDEWSD